MAKMTGSATIEEMRASAPYCNDEAEIAQD
jgi:hypothetical protein